jgi:hypothetical protein
MKQTPLNIVVIALLTSCGTTRPVGNSSGLDTPSGDTPITQSLFSDRASTISEENIQKILDGTYKLPQQLRVAIVRLEPTPQLKRYYWSDEQYLKTQQSYLDLFMNNFKQSSRVTKLSIIPDLLISKPHLLQTSEKLLLECRQMLWLYTQLQVTFTLNTNFSQSQT